MSQVVALVQDWRLLLVAVVMLGFAPGAILRLLVRVYPKRHPRRRELQAELYEVPYLERPLFVAQQFETAIFDGIPARWRARGRRRRADVPFGARLTDWRRAYFPLPDEVVDDYLDNDEYLIHQDHPSFRAFVIQNLMNVFALTVVLPPVFMFLWRGGVDWQFWLLVPVLDAVLLFRAFKRLSDRYTTYVITNLRLIRLSGIVSRKLASIAWTRMTGVGYSQTLMGQFLGYATIHVESADEEAPDLRRFADINDPERFHQLILDMVSGKIGLEEGEEPPAPTVGVRKSLRELRKERLDANMGLRRHR